MAAPLRDHWATLIRDPVERRALVRPLLLATKLRLAVTAIVVVVVVVAVLLSDLLAQRPIETYATRIQQGWLLRMADRVDGPGDPMVQLARDDLEELGLGANAIVVDLREGRVADGAEDALSPSELAWIQAGGEEGGTSLGLDSAHVFAWRPIDTDKDHALVTVVNRRELSGELSSGRLLFALLALVAAGLGLATAHFLALDVSHTTGRLRNLADRIASGDLSQAEPVESEDELGELAHAFERMSGSLRATVGRVAEAADGVEAAAVQMAQVGSAVTAATADQSRALEHARESVGAINREVAGITDSAQMLSGHVEEAGSSVLELGAAGEELNQTSSTLNEQVDGVSTSIEQMIRSVRQIADNTEALGGAAADTSSSMSEIAASMRDVDAHAVETARLSSQVLSLAERGARPGAPDGFRNGRDPARYRDDRGGDPRARRPGAGDRRDPRRDRRRRGRDQSAGAERRDHRRAGRGPGSRVLGGRRRDQRARRARALEHEGDRRPDPRGAGRERQGRRARSSRARRRVQQGVSLAAEAGRSLDEINAAARASGERIGEIVQAVREQSRAAMHVAELVERVSGGVAEIRSAGREQDRANQVVLRGAGSMRDVAAAGAPHHRGAVARCGPDPRQHGARARRRGAHPRQPAPADRRVSPRGLVPRADPRAHAQQRGSDPAHERSDAGPQGPGRSPPAGRAEVPDLNARSEAEERR